MYKLIIKSAFASLFRREFRTVIVIVMIAISLWGLLLMQGFYDGMVKQMINNAIKSDCAEVSIFAKGFRENRDIKTSIDREAEIISKLNSSKFVKSYISRVVSDGLVATARYSKNIVIYGVEKDKEINNLQNYIKSGEFTFGSKDRGAIIGYQLAKKLKVDIGKKIILSAQNSLNEIVSISLKVKGIVKTNNMLFDKEAVFIDKNRAKTFLDIEGVSQIAIMLKDYERVDSFREEIKNSFNDIEVFSWGELYPALLQTEEMMVTFNYISYLIIFLTVTVGVFGVVLVSVLERIREFGILRAIGTKFELIAIMIFFESFFMGIIGFIVGSILGYTTLYYFSIYGVDLSAFSSALDEFGMDAITYTIIDIEYFLTAFFAVFCATLLSIVIPLIILRKSKPIEVING
jgi:ABC-type lipoprotein release transport system permease subunit